MSNPQIPLFLQTQPTLELQKKCYHCIDKGWNIIYMLKILKNQLLILLYKLQAWIILRNGKFQLQLRQVGGGEGGRVGVGITPSPVFQRMEEGKAKAGEIPGGDTREPPPPFLVLLTSQILSQWGPVWINVDKLLNSILQVSSELSQDQVCNSF